MKNNNYRTTNVLNNNTTLKKRLAAVISVMAVLILSLAVFVYADGEGPDNSLRQNNGIAGGAYEVTKYDIRATVGKDHTYDIEEYISVTIPKSLQKIEFAIPSGSFRVRGLTVDGAAFTSNISSSGSTVTIVDQQALTEGEHKYKITYKILEFADRNSNRDLFYFNVLLPEWRQPVSDLHALIVFPADFPFKDVQHYCGQYGAQDPENRLTFKIEKSSRSISIAGKRIPENYGISLKAELPDGYWEGALDGVWAIFAMILVMGTAVLIMLIMWIIGGRDPRIRRVPQTKPIDGVSPVELGYVFNNRFDGRDLVRMIIYFAIRGYLKISEYEPKRYRLYRLSDPDGEEKLLRTAYGLLFEDVYKGRSLDMDDIGERLLRIENSIRDDVAAGFSARDKQAYTPLSKAFRLVCIILIGAAVAVSNGLKYSYQYVSVNYLESVFIGAAIAVLTVLLCVSVDRRDSSSGETGRTMVLITGAILAGAVMYFAAGIIGSTGHILAGLIVAGLCGAAVFLAVIMRARGKANSVLMMQLRQLRRFIAHPTPKELLENFLADPGYYYDMMIYALTFGSEEAWAISFLTLDVPDPVWYSDDTEGHAFSKLQDKPTTVDLARDIRAFVRIIESGYEEMQRRRRAR